MNLEFVLQYVQGFSCLGLETAPDTVASVSKTSALAPFGSSIKLN